MVPTFFGNLKSFLLIVVPMNIKILLNWGCEESSCSHVYVRGGSFHFGIILRQQYLHTCNHVLQKTALRSYGLVLKQIILHFKLGLLIVVNMFLCLSKNSRLCPQVLSFYGNNKCLKQGEFVASITDHRLSKAFYSFIFLGG